MFEPHLSYEDISKTGIWKHLSKGFIVRPGCVRHFVICTDRVIWRILQNDHLVLFTQPEAHGLTTDLDFYSLKDTQTHDI